MKRFFILLFSFSALATFAQSNIIVGDMNGDGKLTVNDVTILTSTIIGERDIVQKTCVDEYEYVDLGLPSGTLWATHNLGATAPEELGSLYAWAELATKQTYLWSNYRYMAKGVTDWEGCNKYTIDDQRWTVKGWCVWYNSASPTHFCGDGKSILDNGDDAAYMTWGKDWHLPTPDQLSELIESTNKKWTKLNGVEGYLFTSKKSGNTNSLFIPAENIYTTQYWSNKLYDYSSHARTLFMANGNLIIGSQARYIGSYIRPVRTK